MPLSRFAALPLLILAIASARAANPFLNAADDRPVSAEFRGAEWGDDIPQDELPLTARVVTTRIAKMPWGAIYKIEFTALKSHAKEHRQIPPEYFMATDDRIILLNEEDMSAAIKQISAMD